MCRCPMAIDVVSQHGPNPQSRTPDRSVSLPDARETAAEMMGSVTSIRLQRLRARHADLQKRHGDRLRDTSAPYDQALEQVVDELAEIEAEIRELDPPDDPPPPPLVQTWDLDDPAQRKAAIEKWGGRHLDPVPDLPPGTSAMSGVEGVPGGFDFDDFDAQLAQAIEGTLESAAPTTAEQSEAWDLVEGGRRSGTPLFEAWAVTEAGDSLERERERARELWSEATPFDQRVADAAGRALVSHDPDEVGAEGILSAVLDDLLGHAGTHPDRQRIAESFWNMGYDRALDLESGYSHESGAAEPSALPANPVPWEAIHENQRWEALERTQEALDLFDEGTISVEELERRRELSDEEMDRMYDEWRREDRQERAAQWEDPRPHSDDEFSHESRAVNLPSGLPAFQSPSVSPGLPAFQGMPAPGGLGGFQPAAALPQSGGYQGAPPSVESMLTAMSGEPPRTGRAHPERPPAPYEPGPEISEEDRKRGKEEIEKIRKEHDFLNPESRMDASILPEMLAQGTAQESEGYFGGLGNLVESVVEAVPGIDTKTAIMIATAIAAATAAGTGFGGPLVPPILAGGAMLSSQ